MGVLSTGLPVIAFNRVDGFYYPGYQTSTLDARLSTVHFFTLQSQELPHSKIIPIGGAVACPVLTTGDFVLVMLRHRHTGVEYYVPGVVRFLPRDHTYFTRCYSVSLYNGKMVTKIRKDLVKIGSQRYDDIIFSIHDIHSRTLHARNRDSGTYRAIVEMPKPRRVLRLTRPRNVKPRPRPRLLYPRSSTPAESFPALGASKRLRQTDTPSGNNRRFQMERKEDKDIPKQQQNTSPKLETGPNTTTDVVVMEMSGSARSHGSPEPEVRCRKEDSIQIQTSLGDGTATPKEAEISYSETWTEASSHVSDSVNASVQTTFGSPDLVDASVQTTDRTSPTDRQMHGHSGLIRTRSVMTNTPVIETATVDVQTDSSWISESKIICKGRESTHSGHHVTQSGRESTHSGHHVTQSGRESTHSGHHVTQSGRESTRSGRHVTQSGRESTHSGHHVTQSGRESTRSGRHVMESSTNTLANTASTSLPSPDLPLRDEKEMLTGEVLEDGEELEDTEVLARWSDDGWYYTGRVLLSSHTGHYVVRDVTGHMEVIAKDDIVLDEQQRYDVIQPKDHVLALHPDYLFSYAPGIVLEVYGHYGCKVSFFDRTVAKIPCQEAYKVTALKYRQVVEFINECERRLVGKDVVARDNTTGCYKEGMVECLGRGRQQYSICWRDGAVSEQQANHVFEMSSLARTQDNWEHVLTIADHSSCVYLPGRIVGPVGSTVTVHFCNGTRVSGVRLEQCYWLSEDYYHNAVRFFSHCSRNLARYESPLGLGDITLTDKASPFR